MTVSLAFLLQSQVPAAVRQRGEGVFASGSVTVRQHTSTTVEAAVQGHHLYDVRLELHRQELAVACTCPYFADRGPCKHIWATILDSDQQGLLPMPQGTRRLRIEDGLDADLDEFEPPDDLVTPETVEEPFARAINRVLAGLKGRGNVSPMPRPAPPPPPSWRDVIEPLTESEHSYDPSWDRSSGPREILYVVDIERSAREKSLVVDLSCRQMTRKGTWGKVKRLNLRESEVDRMPLESDRTTVSILTGGSRGYNYGYYGGLSDSFTVRSPLYDTIWPMILATGRCLARRTHRAVPVPLQMEDGPPWTFRLRVTKEAHGYDVAGVLSRGEESATVSPDIWLALDGWIVRGGGRVARMEPRGVQRWVQVLASREEPIRVPVKQGRDLVEKLYQARLLPPLEWPDDLKPIEVKNEPVPCLKILKSGDYTWKQDALWATLEFDYGGRRIGAEESGRALFLPDTNTAILRDGVLEKQAEERLLRLGFRSPGFHSTDKPVLEFAARTLPAIVTELVREHWRVEAEGKLYRSPGRLSVNVTTGIDWFELRGTVNYGDTTVDLPALLAAVRRQEGVVRLDDGSLGVLPEEWLAKYGALAGMGEAKDDHLRFTKAQAGFLDVLLAEIPEATCDETFETLRREIRTFDRIAPIKSGDGFSGILRGYQEDGLGWLLFLQQFGFGGCLADDMGLGKTVQVLAVLDRAREKGDTREGKEGRRPSLVVVPRSLIFNWKQEAARFTPGLKILDNTGKDRTKDPGVFRVFDVVLTTYGTLLRDIAHLKDAEFDYVILDEAQAIKNASAQTAKAVRLLKGRHRLAMSGTPVQNHLGELWSLFEFLNPGMLGRASVFKLTDAGMRAPGEETRVLLARALRPFILRRTKGQVAKDLPDRTEETLFCELDAKQRKLYDELRAHYRRSLLPEIEKQGLSRSKMHVLEALLRLRQAACHPGLIDKERVAESSAKLEALIPQLAEVVEEDHKVLVFSQFTSFLSIVKRRLETEGIVYEYLDGKTRDRESKVRRFQEDPDCKLFLISLKAGGLGLNLTAAEYVYLLDPWWNPAVEAQAIDRAHRIGQTRKVFAYRLIAKDTVEEKVLELQKTKRDLADSILSADNSLISTLRREDLEMLLG